MSYPILKKKEKTPENIMLRAICMFLCDRVEGSVVCRAPDCDDENFTRLLGTFW